MKPTIALLIVLGLSVAVSGCVSTRTISVAAAGTSRTADGRGSPVPPSQQKTDVRVLLVTPKFSNDTDALPTFYVEVRNRGEIGVDFSTENITAYSGESRVRVYTYDELANRIKSEAEAEAAAVAANEASQLKNSAMSRAPAGRNMKDNPEGWAVTKAQVDAQNGMDRTGWMGVQQQNDLRRMLQRSTVPPGGTAGGAVKLHAEDIRSGQPLKLVVTVGGEAHEFVFEVER